MDEPRIQPAGDSSVLVTFGSHIDLAINRRVHGLALRVRNNSLEGIGEAVPGYAALLVHYDPQILNFQEVTGWLRQHFAPLDDWNAEPRVIEIPVAYGGSNGPDLGFVAELHGMTVDEVIRIHTSREYPVFMMGFTPGFPYLGGMNPAIATPRLSTPRSRVPAGSVGIAGEQTGVYPVDSPGGWRIIGYTKEKLFDRDRQPPFLLSPGDIVRFSRLGSA
jgi:KipI family sensor histidine kinase inhibitor